MGRFKKFWHGVVRAMAGPPPSQPVQLNIINAIELKPECSYILVADSHATPRPEIERIMRDVRRAGVKNVVSFMLQGAPEDAIQVISKGKDHATKPTRR